MTGSTIPGMESVESSQEQLPRDLKSPKLTVISNSFSWEILKAKVQDLSSGRNDSKYMQNVRN